MQLYPATGHSFDRGGSAPQLGIAISGRATHSAARSGGGDAAAAADAWTRTLAFFRKYL
jgi:dienelactone hydrolase